MCLPTVMYKVLHAGRVAMKNNFKVDAVVYSDHFKYKACINN